VKIKPVVVALALAGIPALASASPTQISTFATAGNTLKVERVAISPGNPDIGPNPNSIVTISFRNTGNVAATAVEFRVNYGGFPTTIDDVGTFSKGALVTHTFYNRLDPRFVNARRDVEIAAVHYADGSEWSEDALSLPVIPRRQATLQKASFSGQLNSY
jgi:hypothetical protein